MIPINYYLYLAAFLFSVGLLIVIVKRHTILMLMGIELMLNAANLNLVAFSRQDTAQTGEIFALFVMVIAAAETAVALAILILLYRYTQQTDPSTFTHLHDR